MEPGCKRRGYGRGAQPAAPKRPRCQCSTDPTGDIGGRARRSLFRVSVSWASRRRAVVKVSRACADGVTPPLCHVAPLFRLVFSLLFVFGWVFLLVFNVV